MAKRQNILDNALDGYIQSMAIEMPVDKQVILRAERQVENNVEKPVNSHVKEPVEAQAPVKVALAGEITRNPKKEIKDKKVTFTFKESFWLKFKEATKVNNVGQNAAIEELMALYIRATFDENES